MLMSAEFRKLRTYGHEHPADIPWDVHPRPQMKRSSFICLNGWWDFRADEESGKVLVPYPVESSLSGIGKHFPEGTLLWYTRKLPPVSFNETEKVLLHVDAVDQEADLFINNVPVTHFHTLKGYDGIDITSFLKNSRKSSGPESDAASANNSDGAVLSICVKDDLRKKEFPYGKQRLKRGGMWYTPFSGIWQTVWLEVVPAEHITALSIEPSLTEAVIRVSGVSEGLVIFEGKEIPLSDGTALLKPEKPVCWTPDDPKLYDFTVCCKEDVVRSYFALRTISVKEENGIPRLCLNGKPFFFHGLLDQGYWPDGLCTPPDPSCYADDIKAMKELGFNTLRKHIKVEPAQFYYECDRLGMVVFQDMVNNGTYSFFKDTLLPTIGFKKMNDRRFEKSDWVRELFLSSMDLIVDRLRNHPSICLWTIFNEGWGQFDSSNAYEKLKERDPSRLIDTASGWFLPKKSDVESLHVYFKKFKLKASEKPVLLSEFGGYSFKMTEHSFNPGRTYGYRFYKDNAAFMSAFLKLYRNEIIPAAKQGLSGAIYTQVSDVEDETNGLLTYDRAVCKADKSSLRAIAGKLLQ